jgi:altronate hydrolase/altronate dehydratase small subunit
VNAAEAQGALVLNERDDVAVLLRSVTIGERLLAGGAGQAVELRAACALPLGHKVALRRLPAGAPVRKYGEVIGRLTAAAEAADHVHVHNLASLRGKNLAAGSEQLPEVEQQAER